MISIKFNMPILHKNLAILSISYDMHISPENPPLPLSHRNPSFCSQQGQPHVPVDSPGFESRKNQVNGLS